jgi:hypothetical protein
MNLNRQLPEAGGPRLFCNTSAGSNKHSSLPGTLIATGVCTVLHRASEGGLNAEELSMYWS